ncbi:uroporphyrinogen-III synthase [Parasphingopyxis sp.]|uniref:uroporphyrinogen-III synthase n=1 Tax=Parasphingopyxis sp. TaxID=1920299 RepID=UPI00261E46F7|nr:uroporphyrinogen-III synthase [Parasphingopyxis sp.]
MTSQLVIFRPEPGASQTAQRAADSGWNVLKLPLFTIASLDWDAPAPAPFDAVLMTSANSARFGGPGLARFTHLPLYTVGAHTAEAARDLGFETIVTGDAGAAAMADRLRADGRTKIFHPAGKAARPFDESGLSITRVAAYAAVRTAPPDLSVIGEDAVLLVHSPRSALYLDELCSAQAIARDRLPLVAISEAALAKAGTGWKVAIAVERPSDAAMLDAALALAGPR